MAETTNKVTLPAEALSHVLNEFLVGADPEFAVISPPSQTIMNSGPYAVHHNLVCGEIGFDHSGRVWELRPAPSSSAYQLVVNMWKLFTCAPMSKVEQFKWKGGALGGPHGNSYDTLGGHVHFDTTSIGPVTKRSLDAVTAGLLDLEILPSKENTARIAVAKAAGGYNYGSVDDPDVVRACHGHVEYRAAPSWLDKPGQALMALTAYKLAAARPSSVKWPNEHNQKHELMLWLEQLGAVDVDAWLTHRLVERRGFEAVQADPTSDFRPRWRKEDLWSQL